MAVCRDIGSASTTTVKYGSAAGIHIIRTQILAAQETNTPIPYPSPPGRCRKINTTVTVMRLVLGGMSLVGLKCYLRKKNFYDHSKEEGQGEARNRRNKTEKHTEYWLGNLKERSRPLGRPRSTWENLLERT